MNPIEVVVEGALTEDGQLLLDEKPNLPPGRVKVLLRPAEDAGTGRTVFDVLKEIWAAQEARGFRGRPVEELLAELDVMRDEWDAGAPTLAGETDVDDAEEMNTASEGPH